MKRKDFLAAIPLLASIPFLKKKTSVIPGKELLHSIDIAKHFHVPPVKLLTYKSETFDQFGTFDECYED